MAELKAGEPFGLDSALQSQINWNLALERTSYDLRTDFIYAPHLSFIYRRAGDELIKDVRAKLSAGIYSPGLPVTIEVPKSFRIEVASSQPRLGPNYSRPGSILLPGDRILYQALADLAVPVIKSKMDWSRSFSHKLAAENSPSMFQPTRTCWNDLQKSLTSHSKSDSFKYVLKIDVANYFGSLNLHTLINVLNDSGYKPAFSSRLETLLLSFTGERSSRGILQGMYPSDLLGNFYLTPIDRFLKETGAASARYVDDIYVFVESVEATHRLLRQLIPELRAYDLVLNEAKSAIKLKATLKTEEPDLEALFDAAVAEISGQIEVEDFDVDYGFQSEWDDDQENRENLELQATEVLFESIPSYQGQEENIERFCLPLFSKSGSPFAVDHVKHAFKTRPAMAQIYSSYLANFLLDDDVMGFLVDLLDDKSLFDWQRMWVLAALSQMTKADDSVVKVAWAIFKDADRHDALRAVAANFVGRFGDHARRKALSNAYAVVSEYIQAAIYYSSRRWPKAERNTAKASWGSHGQLNRLITAAIAKS